VIGSTQQSNTETKDHTMSNSISNSMSNAALVSAELLESNDSGWFISVPDVNSGNAEEVAQEALSAFMAEPDEMGPQTSEPFYSAEAAEDFATMGKGEAPTLVTLPKAFVMVEHESDIDKNGLALDEPEFIPELPEGVNENVWYMSNAALVKKLVSYVTISGETVKGKIIAAGRDKFGPLYVVKVTTGNVKAYAKGSTFAVSAENFGKFLILR